MPLPVFVCTKVQGLHEFGGIMARRISLIMIIVAVSLGSGHLVQSRAAQEKALHSADLAEQGNG